MKTFIYGISLIGLFTFKAVGQNLYSINTQKSTIGWTAFKFTNKTGVKGNFNAVKILNPHKGKTIGETLVNSKFAIPVNSIFSNNEDRDNKLKDLFFGSMKNTSFILGKFKSIEKNKGTVTLTFNSQTHTIPFTYTIVGNELKLKSTLDLKDWGAQNALQKLHAACEFLHKGEDGISKTWDVVDLDININFDKN